MLTFGLILAFMSIMTEVILVTTVDFCKDFMLKYEKLGVFFSFALSWFLGVIFGAHGQIALFAGIFSSACTWIIYKTHALKLVDLYREHAADFKVKIIAFAQVAWGATKFFWNILTFPYRTWVSVKQSWIHATSEARSVAKQLTSWTARAKRAP